MTAAAPKMVPIMKARFFDIGVNCCSAVFCDAVDCCTV